MGKNTISVAPAPELVRKALAHCQIPIVYNDDYTVTIDATGVGWDSNGQMTIDEDSELHRILSALITTAMLKHLTDTMVLPSNAQRLREVAEWLESMGETWPEVDEPIDTLRTVAMHLDEQGAST